MNRLSTRLALAVVAFVASAFAVVGLYYAVATYPVVVALGAVGWSLFALARDRRPFWGDRSALSK